jgi:hypothetical protein
MVGVVEAQSDRSLLLAQEELQRQIELGREAQALLSSPALDKFFSEFEAQCLDEIDAQGFKNRDIRERASDLLTICRKFKKSLEYWAQEGELSKQQLDLLLEKKKPGFIDRLMDIP